MIGIVGGIGPLAGADLYKKLVDHTLAVIDQEHLPVLLASLPADIPERTGFLMGKTEVNPAAGLAKVILLLENAGADLIGVACNSAHAPVIFDRMLEILQENHSKAEIVNLIDITVQEILDNPARPKRVGILSTSGSYLTKLYHTPLLAAGLDPVVLPFEQHDTLVQQSIIEIKLMTDEVPPQVITNLNAAISAMKSAGAEALILGCTEIGMVERSLDFQDLVVFNPNTILARTLIKKTAPHKLKPVL